MKKPTSRSKIGLRGWHMIYTGLDLHKSFSVITTMNAQGKEMVKQKRLLNNGEA